jgi:hypothetical protein
MFEVKELKKLTYRILQESRFPQPAPPISCAFLIIEFYKILPSGGLQGLSPAFSGTNP